MALAVLSPEELEALLERAAERGAERALARGASSGVLTTSQAARLAGVGPETIREWHRSGRLRASRDGRTLRIERADLDRARAGDVPDPHEAAAQALRTLRLAR